MTNHQAEPLLESLRQLNEVGQLLTQQRDSQEGPQNIVDQIRAALKADLVIVRSHRSNN